MMKGSMAPSAMAAMGLVGTRLTSHSPMVRTWLSAPPLPARLSLRLAAASGSAGRRPTRGGVTMAVRMAAKAMRARKRPMALRADPTHRPNVRPHDAHHQQRSHQWNHRHPDGVDPDAPQGLDPLSRPVIQGRDSGGGHSEPGQEAER